MNAPNVRAEERARTEKASEDVTAENIHNTKGKTQVQEVQRVPGRINLRRNTERHIVIKLMKIKDKDKILKATREKNNKLHTRNTHQVIS